MFVKRWQGIKKLRYFMTVVMLLLVVVIYSIGGLVLEGLGSLYSDFYQIRMRDNPMTVSQANAMMQTKTLTGEKMEVGYTLWTQKGGQPTKNLGLSKEISADVIYYYGDKNKQFNLNLDNGCALSKEAAFDLWGTDEVLGETIEIDGKTYIVEKVVKKLKADAIARADKVDDINFNVLDVAASQSEEAFSIEDVFTENFIDNTLILNYNELLSLLETLRALPMWLLAGVYTVLLLRKTYESRKEWNRAAVLGFGAVIPLILCKIFCGFHFSVWERFIPVKWSDFSFWQEGFTRLIEEFQIISSMEKYAFDTEFWKLFYGSVAMSIIAAAILAVAVLLVVQSVGKERVKHGVDSMQKSLEEIWRNKGGNRFLPGNKG